MPLSREVKGGRKAFYSDPELDKMLARMARLMTEHWALKERLLTIESLLKERSIISEEDIENFKPSADQEIEWDRQRDQLIRAVLESGQNIES